MKQAVFFVLVVLTGATTVSLSTCTVYLPDNGTTAVMFFNVENLFDAHTDGTEYPEYRPENGWTEADYQDRLSRLGAALSAARPRPDILFLAEVENRRVLENLLGDFLPDLSLPYFAFVGSEGSATGIAVASRYPIISINALLAAAGSNPPLRPAVELRIDVAGRQLLVIAVHWKSKLGSAAATEPIRRAQASIIASRCGAIRNAEPDLPILVLGDFNEQPSELNDVGEAYATALLPARWVLQLTDGIISPADSRAAATVLRACDAGEIPGLLLATDTDQARQISEALPSLRGALFIDPWSDVDGGGSYYYRDEWERIDSIFYSPSLADGRGLEVEGFRVMTLDGAVDEAGRPLSWTASDGGVSDHLPVMIEISSISPVP